MSIAYITHANCQLHDMGSYHPEQPARLQAVEQELKKTGLLNDLTSYQAVQANRQQLQQAHTVDYVASIYDAAPSSGLHQLDPDTSMNQHSLQASLLAAGAGIQAVDLVMAGSHDSVFCNVRPPFSFPSSRT